MFSLDFLPIFIESIGSICDCAQKCLAFEVSPICVNLDPTFSCRMDVLASDLEMVHIDQSGLMYRLKIIEIGFWKHGFSSNLSCSFSIFDFGSFASIPIFKPSQIP